MIGLAVIVAGWIIQLSHIERGEDGFRREFLFLYALGTSLLAIDAFTKGLTVLGIMNLACFAPSMMLLFVISQKHAPNAAADAKSKKQ